MTKRWSRVGVLVSLAAITLAGCRTNVGVAARVDGATIPESTVTDQLSSKGPSAELVQQAKAAGQEIAPARTIVLQYEVQRRLFESELERRGGVPDAGELSSLRARAVGTFLNDGQDIPTAVLGQRLTAIGVKASFAARLVRTLEMEYALGTKLGVQRFRATLPKLGATVSISPRYGTWNAQRLEVVGTKDAGLPEFLKVRRENAVPAGDPNAGG